ncbi:hypothetical protein MUP32_00700, partial [Candidatus Microgenomates bacterium]|nr:hypothetical protein [Candidatus Microgenomates bacterium]
NSSLINAGVTLPSVLYDIDGNSRPQPQGSSYDIGADEYVGTVLPTNTPGPQANITVCQTGGCNFTTIQAAVNAAVPGSIIEVYNGVYYESVTMNVSGAASGWITLRARSGDAVWIDGSTAITVTSNINLGSRSYWKIIGIKGRYAAKGSALASYGAADGITVGVGGHHIVIQDTEIKEPNADGINLRGNNYEIQIINNEIYDMRKANPNWEGDGHAVHVTQVNVAASHDILVKGNFVHDAHGKACLGLADFSSLNAPHPTNIIFEYNKVQDCTNGIKINADGIFRYNLVVDTGKYTTGFEKPYSGFQAFTHDDANNVTNAEIYNNTVVGFDNSYGFMMTGSSRNQTIKIFQNNIAYNPKYYYVNSNMTNFTSPGYNLYYGKGNSAFVNFISELTSIFADPQFNNAAANDYALQSSTSPAKDKGVLVYTGQPYSGTAPDIGAYEYQSGGSVTVTPSSTPSSPTRTPTPPSCPLKSSGDFNCDGKINESDLNSLLGKWMTDENDITGDGKINESDLNKLLGNWKTL